MNPAHDPSPLSIRPPVRQPAPRSKTNPMLLVWAIAFVGVLFGLVQGAEALRNGWNPVATADAGSVPESQVVEPIMHLCSDSKGRPVKQEVACAEAVTELPIKTVRAR